LGDELTWFPTLTGRAVSTLKPARFTGKSALAAIVRRRLCMRTAEFTSQDEQGLGVVIKPGRKFQKRPVTRWANGRWASHAVGDGALFIRGEEHLYRIQSRANAP
jgi:hypothetical protein